MPHYCCMPDCKVKSDKCSNLISWHSIPKVPEKNGEGMKEWRAKLLHVIARADKDFNADNAKMCSRHFEDHCFNISKSGRRTLAFGFLPTKFLQEKSIVTPCKPPRKEPTPRPPPELVEKVCYCNLADVSKDAAKLTYPWVLLESKHDVINIGYIDKTEIKIHVKIDDKLITHIHVLHFRAEALSTSIEKLRLKVYLDELTTKSLCNGIRRKIYQKYATRPTPKSVKKCSYYKHITYTEDIDISSRSTIRSSKCTLLTPTSPTSKICQECKKSLSLIKKKHKRRLTSNECPVSKHTPLQSQAKHKLTQAIKQLRKKQKELTNKLEQFKKNIETEGINVDRDMHKNMMNIIENEEIGDSLMKMFWKEQLKAFSHKKGGMRWHPTMIRLAILIHSRSPAVYQTLRDSGILRLPGTTTLRDYTAIIKPKCGRNEDIIQDINETTKHLKEEERFVILLHDEMSVKADIVYDRTHQKVVGFVNSSNWSFENITQQTLATHVLLFFIVGVNTNLSRSVMYFPTANATAADLYAHFWEVVGDLESSCNLHVIASTSDKASANQKMVRMQTDNNKTVNLFAPDRFIYFFSDVPHLLKTIRNNMFHSGANKTKLLWNNGKHLEWKHVSDLYKLDAATELRRTKLTSDHINLTPRTVMNVKLAAQVFSRSVGVMMEAHGGDQCSETANFIQLTDRFFDCLNVRSVYEGDHKIKPDLQPYTFTTDQRFQFLLDYLKYLDDWKESVAKRPGKFTKSQRRAMFIADQTYQGIRTTIMSAIECTQYLLNNGVEFVLTNRFCQDPLEAHFGRHRGCSGQANNPTVYAFGHQDKKLTIQRNMALLIQPRGNVEKRRHAISVRTSPMKKAKKL